MNRGSGKGFWFSVCVALLGLLLLFVAADLEHRDKCEKAGGIPYKSLCFKQQAIIKLEPKP